MAKRLIGFNMETETETETERKRKSVLRNGVKIPTIDPSKYNVTKAGNVVKKTTKVPCKVVTETQQKIKDILSGMTDLLLYKNKKYGDSAINPKKIFYKGDSTNSILIRLDDKIGRVMSNTEEKPRVNDVADIIGYCTLLLVSMRITSEDLKKFMD